jgi:hypothetical protein
MHPAKNAQATVCAILTNTRALNVWGPFGVVDIGVWAQLAPNLRMRGQVLTVDVSGM